MLTMRRLMLKRQDRSSDMALLALTRNHKPTKHVPAPGNNLCRTLDRTMHGMQVYLCCSGQNPVKDAVYVGFDVLGILTSGNDWNPTLHVPLQAHLYGSTLHAFGCTASWR